MHDQSNALGEQERKMCEIESLVESVRKKKQGLHAQIDHLNSKVT